MKLYRIWQEVNNGYDTFDSAVVAARTSEEATHIHPMDVWGREYDEESDERDETWCTHFDVQAEYLGEAKPGTKPGAIVASFNAG